MVKSLTALSSVMIAPVLLVSCSARKPIVPAYASFRFEAVRGDDSLLLTPAIPQANTGTAAIKLAIKSSPVPPSLHCSAAQGHFSLEQNDGDTSSIQLTMPSPETWVHNIEARMDPPSDQGTEELFAFLADLDKLQAEGCFPDIRVSIRDLILQSLPMRPDDSLFNGYGYLAGRTGLALKAGMRLRIDRAHFRRPEPGQQQHTPQLFLGVSTVYFRVLDNRGKLRFRQHGITAYRPTSLVKRVLHQNSDLALSFIEEETYFRLLFNTLFLPQKHFRSAAIVGAERSSDLDELDEELHAHPEEDCKATAARYRAVCFEFEGDVTVTPQIKVELNGKRTFVDSGTKIKDVLSNSDEQTLKSLRLRRQFMHTFYDLEFEPTDSRVLSVALIGNDRVTWSNLSRKVR